MQKILLAEDDDTMVALLKTLLGLEGYQVATLMDKTGDILENIRLAKPDVLLIDIFLGDQNGLEIVRQIRKMPEFKALKIVMASGIDKTEECLAAGANVFLLKPYMPNELFDILRAQRLGGMADEPVRLRDFHYPEDYPAARALWENAGPGIHVRRSDEPEEIQKKLQRDPDLFLVAEAGGKMIGTVIGGFDGRRGLIYHLAVAADYRTHGIGSLLMDEVERRLKAKGCIRCYLMVAYGNEGAMQFYEARSWERMDTIHTYGKDL